ncbi:lipoyltransferase mitochondrial [Brachionus plicatilis]|uniref:Octanoyl-[acyl-carrier-protein]:protein N-octanoyltransferase LIPT2, mitochondrial n=1 Tax=Brachionus plicatilis TaxID=10195 RepID=A0A3M7T0L7_BRAPC|nr:lipoyltransferase mitochondrial [Brachionus plicatilis]
MKKLVRVINLGRMEYNKCLKIQQHILAENLSSPNSNSLILVEHDPVYTVGLRKQTYSKEYLENLAKLGAQVTKTDRGGLITFHGPGQLVAYPILNLINFEPSLKWYVSRLEEIIIDLCKVNFGLTAYRMCNIGYTGVWCNDAKIAAIGIYAKRLITYHGLSLNCNVDLKWFSNIVPCGITDKSVSSLSKIMDQNLAIKQIEPMFLNSFSRVFDCDLDFVNEEQVRDLIYKVVDK